MKRLLATLILIPPGIVLIAVAVMGLTALLLFDWAVRQVEGEDQYGVWR